MAKSKNEKYEDSSEEYKKATKQYTGIQGFKNFVTARQQSLLESNNILNQAMKKGKQTQQAAAEEGKAQGLDYTNTANKNAEEQSVKQNDLSNAQAASNSATQTALSNAQAAGYSSLLNSMGNAQATGYSKEQNKLLNEEARKYAGEQAGSAAAGTQSQATTAARAAGLNKAQAAMLGSQQNANAYQNAYGNAYSQQLNNAANSYGQQLNNANNNFYQQLGIANNNYGQQLGLANNAYENQANRTMGAMESGKASTAQAINNAAGVYSGTASQYGQARQNADNAAVGASGTGMSAAQQEGQAEYERKWGNWGNGLGIGGSIFKAFSDEDLKHYKECSKKVTIRSPKSIEKLKFVKEGTK
jgi:hypothetical protein